MRTFTDPDGRAHDVLVGKESWGTLVLLFVPRDGGDTRQLVLPEESVLDAERALDAMSDDELRERLAASGSWGG